MWRPRTIVYSLILVTLLAGLVSSLVLSQPVILDVMRDRNTLYRDVGLAGIENSYTMRIVNKHNRDHTYRISVSGLDGITIRTDTEFSVPAESVHTLPVSVTVPHEAATGGNVIEFRLQSIDDSSIAVTGESRFRGPEEY
ncbi:MAG: FixG Ig-like domain-containing protein [Wenzhouxiangellaceae bacterium]